MTRRTARAFALVLSATALTAACGKGAAEHALKAANDAVDKSAPEIDKYVPDQRKAITDAMAKARADFDKGDYKRALASAQELVPKVHAALEAAARKKDELVTAFNGFKETLPRTLAALESRLDRLAKMTSLPSDLDQATVEAAKSNLETLTAAWKKASASFDSGDVIAAVKQGAEVRTALDEMTRAFIPRPATTKAAP